MQTGIEADTQSLIQLRHDARALSVSYQPGSGSALAGNYASRFRGRGMDFAESRVYIPGDDIRSIDWRVTARSGTTHTKVYIEERERPVILLVDFSLSMYFGTRVAFKSVIAAQTAALLTWSTILQGDRIGGIICADEKMSELKHRPGRRGALAMIHALAKATKPPQSDNKNNLLDTVLLHASRVVHPGSLVILISDFYNLSPDNANNYERYLNRLSRHNDLIACRILDPFEAETPRAGRYPVTDGRLQTILDTRLKSSRLDYQKNIEQRDQRLQSLLSKTGVLLLTIRTDLDLITQLSKQFQGRRKH